MCHTFCHCCHHFETKCTVIHFLAPILPPQPQHWKQLYNLPAFEGIFPTLNAHSIEPTGYNLYLRSAPDTFTLDVAHDQSFSLGFAPSLKDLVDESELIDLVFGWCLDRIIHQVVPGTRPDPAASPSPPPKSGPKLLQIRRVSCR